MHLVGNFLGGLILPVNRLIPIKPKFVSPCLQLRCDPVLRRHAVNSLFNLPGFNVWRKCFQGKLHRFPIHRTCRIKVPRFSRPSCLIEGPFYGTWNVGRRLTFWNLGEKSQKFKLHVVSKNIARIFDRANSHPNSDNCQRRPTTSVAGCTNGNGIDAVVEAIKLFADRKSYVVRATVRAVVYQSCHVLCSISNLVILA